MAKDRIFAQPLEKIGDFKFDENVASVFDDMIRRSIPIYEKIIFMLRILAGHYVKPNSNCYDLGCSLGASALSIAGGITQPDCKVFAVDLSEPMIRRCCDNVATVKPPTPVVVMCDDIRNIAIEKASMVVLNFTLQFLPPEDRDELLKKIYDGMLPGGVLVLSEKITHDNPVTRELLIDIYHDWKRSNGYSDMEVSQKRTALENVLKLDTMPYHLERLEKIGFKDCAQWFQCFNFASILAFK